MERNMGEQVNKAFEVYRKASIEKDLAKKELEKTTEFYVRYTQELKQQIEEQREIITKLEAQLLSSAAHQPAAGEIKCEARRQGPCPRKREEPAAVEATVLAGPGAAAASVAVVGSCVHHQQFSMPIQCTDDMAELAERPCALAERPCQLALRSLGVSGVSVSGATARAAGIRATGDVPQNSTALASRGASPEDRDLVDSLTRLSVKFPPALDCEYDFLNSAPERQPAPGKPRPSRIGLPLPLPAVTEELAATVDHRAAPAFGFPPRSPASHCAPPASSPSPSSPSSCSSSSLPENVCGPHQPLWSPVLRELEQGAIGGGASGGGGDSSPDKCAFCHAIVPQDRMNSHLYLHFSHKSEAGSN
ncbi:hypothetical protein CRUP_023351 [Coryphaenoides rupestris]|nr:hypothetical protein CRUP_023351 [Coryphaenoides rupestris]